MKHLPPKTEKEIDELLARIKEKTGLTQEKIAERIGYNRSYISQAKKTDSEKLYNALMNGFKTELENITFHKNEGFSQQSLNNLTESNRILAEANRTLADANKTLAEANHVISKNHDELIQLTKMIVSNSMVLPKNQQAAFGPEENRVSPGFGAVTPSGSPAKSGKQAGKH